MQILCKKWIVSFAETRDSISINTSPVTMIYDEEITIDDILNFLIIFPHSYIIFLVLSRFYKL